ncbi:MAG: transglycosylase domain-containing protein [Candidatus Roizmanbacteria bacterium]
MVRSTFSSKRNRLILSKKVKHYLIRAAIGGSLFIFLFGFGSFWYITKDLPDPGALSLSRADSTIIYDKDGAIIHQLYSDKQRIYVKQEDIPATLKQATVAVEDKDFYHHGGFDPLTVIRIPYNYVFRSGRVVGGSTLTQQLIKQTYLDSSRTATRKIKEVVLAIRIEQKLSKDQILAEYLNIAPYGGTIEGIGAASKAYFDKKPSDLTLLESAILAGLPQNPSIYSPYIGRPNAWKSRTKDVLRRMYEDSYIKKDVYDAALLQVDGYAFKSEKVTFTAPHFVFYVQHQAEGLVGAPAVKQGVRIKTTLDLTLQKKAEEIVFDEVGNLKDYKVGNGAAVALDTKTGEIRAMVGSFDYNEQTYGKFNVVADETALRQPGSTLKPLLVAVAMEKKLITAASVFVDAKTAFPVINQPDYEPVNYDGKFRGPVQIRFALGNSLNIPMVKLMATVGTTEFMTQMEKFGINNLAPTKTNLSRIGLSVALGGGDITMLELAQAYSVLARGGTRVDTSAISEITDATGKVLYRRPEIEVKRIISPETSFIVSHILSDNNARLDAFGSNSLLVIPGKTVAVKTGTTNDKRDNWTAGYTNGIIVVSWVGNNDNTPMNQKIASGITGASPIWNLIMKAALKTYPDGIATKPNSVDATEVDARLGGKVKDNDHKRSEYFLADTAPKDIASGYQKIKISKNQSDKKANDFEISAGQYDERDFIALNEADPVSADGKNRWQEGIEAWIKDQSDSIYKIPQETSDYKPQPTNTPAPTSPPAPTAAPVVPTVPPTSIPTTAVTPTSAPSPSSVPSPTK